MKKLACILLLATCTLAGMAQTLLTINGKDISYQEFEYYYQKNNHNQAQNISREDYLEMFVDFKLKVEEAYVQQYDTASSFQQELNGYRNQLIGPYLTDTLKRNELTKEAYQRLLEEVETSHILVAINNPADADAALKRAKDIRKRLKKSNFASLAKEFSEDPSAQENNGYLGYATGGSYVYPFETAAYSLKKGQISQPVKTAFGYHLIMLHNKRPANGEIRVAHIFKRKPMQADSATLANIKAEVYNIYQQATEGANFATLARKYSEDGSAAQGGELPWISVGNTNATFEEAAFALNAENRLSQPIEADYGWHIIYLLEKRPIRPFEFYKADLQRRVTMDERRRIIQQSFIEQLKKEYNFKWGKKDIVATFADQTLTQTDYQQFLQETAHGADSLEQYIYTRMITYENNHLETKYPTFGLLMNEYREGILLFNIFNDLIWSKASKDTEGLKAFFAEHKEDYPANFTHAKGPVINDYQMWLEKQWVQQLREKYAVTIHYDVLNSHP